MTTGLITDEYVAAERFVDWLTRTIVERARGDDRDEVAGKPSDRFWLGRLAPTAISARSGSDGRGERLEPCQIGVRMRPVTSGPWTATARVRFVMWHRNATGKWAKLDRTDCTIELTIKPDRADQRFGAEELAALLQASTGRADLERFHFKPVRILRPRNSWRIPLG